MIDAENIQRLLAEKGLSQTLEDCLRINEDHIIDLSISGWENVKERTLIFDTALQNWFSELVGEFNPKYRFALAAIGGQGRREITPNSDLDLSLLVEGVAANDDEDEFLKAYVRESRKLISSKQFNFTPIVHDPNTIIGFTGKNLNTYFDLRKLYENQQSEGFVEGVRQTIKDHYDPFDLFLHNLALWQNGKRKYPNPSDDIELFDIKHGIGGLRQFQSAVWLQAAENFSPSTEIYKEVPKEVLDSVGVLLKVRSLVGLGKSNKTKALSDLLKYEDFLSLDSNLRRDLIDGRIVIEQYVQKIVSKRLNPGFKFREHLFYGVHGIYPSVELNTFDDYQKNEVLFSLIQNSQIRTLPIDYSTCHFNLKDINSWVRPNQWINKLFYDRGSLSDSLKNLMNLNIIEILPGFSKLETSIPLQTDRERKLTRGGFARYKLNYLESLISHEEGTDSGRIEKEFECLDLDKRAAIKLALLTKRIPYVRPEMPGVIEVHIRDYMDLLGKEWHFNKEVLSITEFLIENNSKLLNLGFNSLNDSKVVNSLKQECGEDSILKALWIYTHADFGGREGRIKRPHLWDNIDELYTKASTKMDNDKRNILDLESRDFIEDLGHDFLSSRYSGLRDSCLDYLIKLKTSGEPVLKIIPFKGKNTLTVACYDYPGLISVITGNCYRSGINLKQAHAFTLSKHGMALDFFSLDFDKGRDEKEKFLGNLVNSIKGRVHIDNNYLTILRGLEREVGLEFHSGSGYYSLVWNTNQDKPGILYALTRSLYEHLNADIYAMNGFVDFKDKTVNSVFFNTHRSREDIDRFVSNFL